MPSSLAVRKPSPLAFAGSRPCSARTNSLRNVPSSETVSPASPEVRNWRTGNVVARVIAAGGAVRWTLKMVPAKQESKIAKECLESASRTNSPKRRSDSAASLNRGPASGRGASAGTRKASSPSVAPWPENHTNRRASGSAPLMTKNSSKVRLSASDSRSVRNITVKPRRSSSAATARASLTPFERELYTVVTIPKTSTRHPQGGRAQSCDQRVLLRCRHTCTTGIA